MTSCCPRCGSFTHAEEHHEVVTEAEGRVARRCEYLARCRGDLITAADIRREIPNAFGDAFPAPHMSANRAFKVKAIEVGEHGDNSVTLFIQSWPDGQLTLKGSTRL